MSGSGKTVSEAAMLAEWAEVQAAQQDIAAFRPLYDRYYEPIFRFIFRRTGDESITADLSSQVFLSAMQKLSSYSFQGVPFSAWLYRIALNELRQYYRQVNKNRLVSLEEASLLEMMEEIDLDHFEARRSLLLEALDQLKETDLQLIEMRFFEQRPYKEVAAILDLSETNAKVKVHRILERLKRKIKG